MKASSISKMNTIFGSPVPKKLEMSNFIAPTQLFQKLWVLLFCNFQSWKVPLGERCTGVTSHQRKIENSHLNNSRNNGNFDLLLLQIFIILEGLSDWTTRCIYSLIIHVSKWHNRRTIGNNRKIKTVITHVIIEILTYFVLQISIIFDGLSDSTTR